MSKLPKIILIHGNGGGELSHDWWPYVRQELEKLGLDVVARNFPDNQIARESIWIPFLKNELKADENTLIIGWSSGAVAAMRFAEKNKIYASILVSPCYTDLGDATEKLSGYYNRPWDWDAIKKNQSWIVQFYSTDDSYIPPAEAHFIRDHLNTEYHEFTDQKHFFPKQDFPEIIEVIKKKLDL